MQPQIIYEKFPFTTSLRYNHRHKNNLPLIKCKKHNFYNSYFIKNFRLWNTLHPIVKNTDNYTEFKEQYIKINKETQNINENDFQFSYETEVDRIYLSFRMNNSKLQNDKFKYNMCNTPLCQNCNMMKNETVYHYIFECPKYKIIRKILDRKIKSLAKIKNKSKKFILNLLLTKNEGNLLTNTEFKNLIMSLKYYILRTHRFI